MSRSETANLWRERLRRFASSQISVSQFSLSEGVSQPSYYYWKKKLRELPSDAKSKSPVTDLQFMPLRLATESANPIIPQSDEQAGPPVAGTTIELPGGVRIRVEVPMDRKPGWPLEDPA